MTPSPTPSLAGEPSDEQIEEIAARICSQSLQATRVHELGGTTLTMFEPVALIEFARAILAAAGETKAPHGLPDGVLFDAFGRERVRYVRVIHDGTTCVVRPGDVDALVDSERPDDYRTEDVYLSKEEFDVLPEFDGF